MAAAPASPARRRLARLVLAGGVAVVSVGVFSGPAGAQAPRLQGWWASTNPGGLPVDPPQPPDVPADGLLVQAGPSGPSAYAALTYDLESGATADALTLQLAPGALPSAPPTLTLCALRSPSFAAEQGGPMGDAPAYDCTRTASAPLDGSSFTFKAGGLASDGVLAVAVLPGDPSTRAVLARPSEGSLTVTSGSSAVLGTSLPPASGAGTTTGAGAAAPPALPGLTGSATVPAPAAAAPVLPAQVAPGQAPAVAAPSGTTALPATTPVAATRSAGGGLRRVLVVLVVAALTSALVAWAFVGSGPEPGEATG